MIRYFRSDMFLWLGFGKYIEFAWHTHTSDRKHGVIVQTHALAKTLHHHPSSPRSPQDPSYHLRIFLPISAPIFIPPQLRSKRVTADEILAQLMARGKQNRLACTLQADRRDGNGEKVNETHNRQRAAPSFLSLGRADGFEIVFVGWNGRC